MSADIQNTKHYDVIEHLGGNSDPEKARLSKRWDKDKDYQTYGFSANDYTALYERFDPGFKRPHPRPAPPPFRQMDPVRERSPRTASTSEKMLG